MQQQRGIKVCLCRFQERRTWFATFLAYFRIIAFHILWFHSLLALSFVFDDAQVTLCKEEGLDWDSYNVCTKTDLREGTCENSKGASCPLGDRVLTYRFKEDVFRDEDDKTESPWNKQWMGISSVVITHAVLQMIYAYGVLYTRLKVAPPPAGQNDMRKQVWPASPSPTRCDLRQPGVTCVCPRSMLWHLEDAVHSPLQLLNMAAFLMP